MLTSRPSLTPGCGVIADGMNSATGMRSSSIESIVAGQRALSEGSPNLVHVGTPEPKPQQGAEAAAEVQQDEGQKAEHIMKEAVDAATTAERAARVMQSQSVFTPNGRRRGRQKERKRREKTGTTPTPEEGGSILSTPIRSRSRERQQEDGGELC